MTNDSDDLVLRGPTIIDRLSRFDDQGHPWAPRELVDRAEADRILRRSVALEIERLLRMRRPLWSSAHERAELAESLATCGVPDVNSYGLSTPSGEARFLDEMEEAISLHEPRLRNVRVSRPVDEADAPPAFDGVLRFQIVGELARDGRKFGVEFQSQMEFRNGRVLVEGVAR